MTEDAFLAWYPQFSSFTPAVVLRETVSRANGLFSGMEPEDVEEARRLYTAHRLTLYVLAQPDENNKSPKAAASAAKEARGITEKTRMMTLTIPPSTPA